MRAHPAGSVLLKKCQKKPCAAHSKQTPHFSNHRNTSLNTRRASRAHDAIKSLHAFGKTHSERLLGKLFFSCLHIRLFALRAAAALVYISLSSPLSSPAFVHLLHLFSAPLPSPPNPSPTPFPFCLLHVSLSICCLSSVCGWRTEAAPYLMQSSQESQTEKMIKICFSAAALPAAAPGGETMLLIRNT